MKSHLYKMIYALLVNLSILISAQSKPLCFKPLTCNSSLNNDILLLEDPRHLYSAIGPQAWVTLQVDTFIRYTQALTPVNPIEVLKPQNLRIQAKRNPFRNHLYNSGLVEASFRTALMSDKLLMAKILEHYLGDEFSKYHLKTLGLKEFLWQNNLVDKSGHIIKTRNEIENILFEHFPGGFLIKPATGMSSASKNLIIDTERVIDLLISQNGQLYAPEEFLLPYKWSELPIVTSGERFVLQEVIQDAETNIALMDPPLFYQQDDEFRVHSFWHQVVPGATTKRWYTKEDELQNKQADAFIQSLLSQLPLQLTQFQAWSFDVFKLRDKTFKLIEINTNRGKKTNWSGFNRVPQNLGAYIRHFEKTYKWHFEGISGLLLRNNLGNLKSHFLHEYPLYLEEYMQILKSKLSSLTEKKENKKNILQKACIILLSDEY